MNISFQGGSGSTNKSMVLFLLITTYGFKKGVLVYVLLNVNPHFNLIVFDHTLLTFTHKYSVQVTVNMAKREATFTRAAVHSPKGKISAQGFAPKLIKDHDLQMLTNIKFMS